MLSQVSLIDNLIVVIYLLIILGIGLISRTRINSFKGFATIKNSAKTTKLVLVATIFASAVGGGTTFGIAEKAFAGDLSNSYALLLTIPVDLLIAYFLVPRLILHKGIESIGDIMIKYYGLPGKIIGGVAAIIVSLGYLAAQISVSGRIFQYILDIDYIKAVIISYSIIIIYTTVGGLRSVITTNVFQFFAMVLAIPLITIISIDNIGLMNFYENLPLDKISFTTNSDLMFNTVSAALGFAVIGLFPNFIQRVLITNNPQETIKAIYFKSIIYGIFLIFITLNGLLAYQLFPDENSSQSLPRLIDAMMPVGIKGLVVVGLLAAVMSTADSDLNVISVAIAKDICAPIFSITNDQKLLRIAQIVNIFVGIFAILLALKFTSVVDLVVFIAGFWGPVIVVPLIFSLYNITIPKWSFVFSSFSGVSSFVIWEYYFRATYCLKSVFIGTLVHLIVFLLMLAFTRSSKSINPSPHSIKL